STTSHHLCLPSLGLMASAKALVSVRVLFIFQLPAMIVLRYFRFILGNFLSIFPLSSRGTRSPAIFWFYLSSRQATPGASSQSPLSFVSAQGRRKLHLLPCSSFPHRTRFVGLRRGPLAELPGRKLFTYPTGRPRRAAPCPPGTPGRRRRRWRCGSSCRRSPAGPRRPRCRRRR